MKPLNLIGQYFVERKKQVILGLLSLIIVDAFQVFIPRVMKWTIDDIAEFNITNENLIKYSGLIIMSAVFIGIFRFIWRYYLIGTSRRVEEGIRNKLYAHIMTLSDNYFYRVKTGDIMAHATNDISNVRMATGMGIVAITDTIILGITVICFMCYISVPLTLFALIPAPFLIIITKIFSKKMHAQYRRVQAVFSDMTEIARERFSGIRIIKIFKRETHEITMFHKVSEEYVKENMMLVRYTGMLFPMMIFLTNSSIAAVIYFGGSGVIIQTITPGDFVAFISYLGLLTWPMMAIGWVINLIQRGRASLERINTILNEKPDIESKTNTKPFTSLKHTIQISNVSFNYDLKRTGSILSDIDYCIRKNQFIGICGPPGCGKTTLVNLLPRISDVTGGRILFDETDIRDISLKDLRRLISFMPQEPFLFSGTIRENLFINQTHTKQEILDSVLEISSLTETINSFPNGLDTVIGEKGIVLSGGQKQRLALCRTLLKPCEVLILDDPVSQVDLTTAQSIIDKLSIFSKNKTVIVISHRYKIFEKANDIIIMKKGKICDHGTHNKLLKSSLYYRDIYNMQMNESSDS